MCDLSERRRIGAATGLWTDPGTWVLAVDGALVAFFLVWMQFHWGGESRVALVNGLIALTLGLSLAGMTWRASRSPGLAGATRLGWQLISVAAAYSLLLAVWVGLWQTSGELHVQQDASLGALVVAAFILMALVLAWQALSARELARLRAEQAARQSEAHFASLVRHSSDVISLIGPDSRIRFVSPASLGVLGLAPESLQDTSLLDLIHPQDRPQAAVFLRRILAHQGVAAVTEWRLRHADGSWRDMETLATKLAEEPAVCGVVLNSRDITERKRLEERLRQLAFQDPLTGLANRTLFRERLEHALTRAVRSQESVTLLYLDLDDFKRVNDRLGHAAGDTLLKTAAERLLECSRPADTVARLGGDELAVLIEEPLPRDTAVALAERIAARLAEPVVLAGQEVQVTASIGIVQGGPGDGVDKLIGKADLAMYSAKSRGKHGHALFETWMHAAAMERMDSELDLGSQRIAKPRVRPLAGAAGNYSNPPGRAPVNPTGQYHSSASAVPRAVAASSRA